MDLSGNGRSSFVDFNLNPLTFHIYRSFADIYCCMTGQFSPKPLSVFEGLGSKGHILPLSVLRSCNDFLDALASLDLKLSVSE